MNPDKIKDIKNDIQEANSWQRKNFVTDPPAAKFAIECCVDHGASLLTETVRLGGLLEDAAQKFERFAGQAGIAGTQWEGYLRQEAAKLRQAIGG